MICLLASTAAFSSPTFTGRKSLAATAASDPWRMMPEDPEPEVSTQLQIASVPRVYSVSHFKFIVYVTISQLKNGCIRLIHVAKTQTKNLLQPQFECQ